MSTGFTMIQNFADNQRVLIDDPLYTQYDLSGERDDEIRSTFRSGSVDAYCPSCKCLSVFRIQAPRSYGLSSSEPEKITSYGLIAVHAICVRQNPEGFTDKCEQDLHVLFHRSGNDLIKIGLYPAKADMDFGLLDDAHKELPSEMRRELGTAIGLSSHGVGIGAFVYLRRIFERLVQDAYEAALAADEVDKLNYENSRMSEKIRLLAGRLPSRLVQSANLYGVLSKGIHELSDAECREKFPLVRQAIHLILSQRHEEREYEKIVGKLQHGTGS
jgi:hypothetical protein